MKLRKITKNKKANLGAVAGLALITLIFILGAAFIATFSGVITFTSDEINDITSQLGMAGDSNLSAISDVSIGTANNVIQTFKWLSGVMIIFGLLGIIIFAGVIRANPNGFLIGLYLLLVIVLVFSAIYMSNTYEQILDGNDSIGQELQEMPVASFLVLYMPAIIVIMSFIGGIIIFSGIGEEFV